MFSAVVTEYLNLDGLQINKQTTGTGFIWFTVLGTRKSRVKWLQLVWVTAAQRVVEYMEEKVSPCETLELGDWIQ